MFEDRVFVEKCEGKCVMCKKCVMGEKCVTGGGKCVRGKVCDGESV